MKVYLPGNGRGTHAERHVMHVQPGNDMRGQECPSAWFDTNNGNVPLLFAVEFRHGVAEVEHELGKYLVDRKLALKSRPLLRAA